MHIFRWDLDRTYLLTEIDSVRGLVRAAMEQAADKVSVPGAAALLRGLQAHDPGARTCVLSGSPLQMRAVLTEKLALDGIRVDRLILKDNLGNLRRGRFRALRGQIGYKLPHLLEERAAAGVGDTETLFGDDCEVDGLIYAAYAAVLAGELDRDGLVALLRAGEAYPDAIDRAVEAAARVRRGRAVEDTFIRVDRGLPHALFRRLGAEVLAVHAWFQAAVVLATRGRLGPEGVADVWEATGADEVAGANLVQDVVRRAALARDRVSEALSAPRIAGLRALADRRSVLLGPRTERRAAIQENDFIGFLRAVTTR